MNIYVLHVLGKNEHRIKEYINTHTLYEAIVPVKIKLIRRKATIIKQEQMLFPSYVFVRSDLQPHAFKVFTQRYLSNLSGFIRLLTYKDDDVASLTFEEMKALEPFFFNRGVFEHSIGLINHDRVVITEGPLMGLESYIKHIDRHKRLATLEVPLFNEIKEVKVSCEILSKLT